jgi:hypothetical protein
LRKVIIFQKREAGVDRPAFSRWALREQVLLVEKIPGLRRCVVSLEAEGPELRRYQVNVVEDGPESFVDGVAEVCFADLPALQRIMSRSDVRNVQQDSQVHTQARYRMFVEEHVVLAPS